MLFSATSAGLVVWCRAFKHGLAAGLSLPRVFHLQGNRGPRALRPMATRIAERLEKGDSLEDAMEVEGDLLPKLFRELTAVGERTGRLPDMFSELADYYELQQRLSRQFWSEATWPIFQFFAAVFVIFFLIVIMGFLAKEGGAAAPPIGFGLIGFKGGIIFLFAVGTFLGSLLGVYLVITRVLKQRAAFEAFLLRVPAIGPCIQCFSMGRFCLALRATLESGMSAHEALQQSLRATGNAAFTSQEEGVVAQVKAGEEIHVALRRCSAFPDEFLEIVAVAEISGQIPEVMIRQAEMYREESARKLKNLTKVASFAVWFFVAAMMVMAIFRIASLYTGALNAAGG